MDQHEWHVFTEHEPRVLSEGLIPTGSALLHPTLCFPPQSPFFPSLFIASLSLIYLHRSFSALLSRSPLLFAEVMTELPWHMLSGWTSRASKHKCIATQRTYAERITAGLPYQPGPMRWWWKIMYAAGKMDCKTPQNTLQSTDRSNDIC